MERVSTVESVLPIEERRRYAPYLIYWLILGLTLALWGLPIAVLAHVLTLPESERMHQAVAPLIMIGLIIFFELVMWRKTHWKALCDAVQRNIIGWYRFTHRCTSTGKIVSEYRVGRKKYPFICCPDSPRVVEPCGGLFPKGEVIWYGTGNKTEVIGTVTFFRPTIHIVKKDPSGYVLYELIDSRNQRGQYPSLEQLLAHVGTASG